MKNKKSYKYIIRFIDEHDVDYSEEYADWLDEITDLEEDGLEHFFKKHFHRFH